MTTETEANVLEVNEPLARQMLVEMGFAGAESGWQPIKLVKVLNRLPERLGACEEPKAKVTKILLDQIVKALSNGKTIALASANGEVPKAKKEPKAKMTKKESKAPKEPSNKEVVFKLWKQKNSVDPEVCFTEVKEAVKLQTIKSWIKDCVKGTNFPACAKSE